jgi:acyl carrier protein
VNTLERVKSLFLKNFDFPEERLQLEATIESIGLDSLDKIEFLFALEKEFNVKIPDREVTLNSLKDIISVIERLVHEQDGHADHQDG